MKTSLLLAFIGAALIAAALLIFVLLEEDSSSGGGTEGIPSSATLFILSSHDL